MPLVADSTNEVNVTCSVSHSLLVSSLLQPLVLPIARGECCLLVGWCLGVEDPNIHECLLKPSTPKTIGSDVQAGTIFSDGTRTRHHFPSEWLEFGLNPHVMAHLNVRIARMTRFARFALFCAFCA